MSFVKVRKITIIH